MEHVIQEVVQEEFSDSNGSTDDEVEVELELETLKADNVYHDFVQSVVARTPIPEDANDQDYNLVNDLQKEGKTDLADLSSSDSDSDFEDAVDEAGDQEVKIPQDTFKDAAMRNPPFWRVKYQLGRVSEEDYKSDEDPDYNPPRQIDGTQEFREHEEMSDEDKSSASSSEDESDEAIEPEADVDVENLAEMIDDLAIPEQPKEVDPEEAAPQPSLVRSITEFDTDGYKSDEDHDFVPQPEELAKAENSSDETSSDEESEEEEMEE